MKIAIFHELQILSGARKMVDEYGKILSKTHTVDLYYSDNKEDSNLNKYFTNAHYFQFLEKKWIGNNWSLKLYKDTLELFKLYYFHKKISSEINKGNYDIVFVHPSKLTQAPFILRFLTAKKVYYSPETLRLVYDDSFFLEKGTNFFKEIYEKFNRQVRKQIDKQNILKANLVLTNSKFSQQNILKAYNIKSFVCYPGVDENKYKPSSTKKIYEIFFLGEKTDLEGFDIFNQVLKSYKTDLRVKYIEREKKPISENNMIQAYNTSKIAVALSRNEPFGMGTIEAMSCGVPVIALKEGGFIEAVENGKTGYLVDKNKNQIKEKIDSLLHNEDLRIELGKNARQKVIKEFTWETSVNNFLKIIKKL